MKSPALKKFPLLGTPRLAVGTPQVPCDGELYASGNTFFAHAMKAAGVTQKEVMYAMHVNKTTANGWYTGKKRDPFARSAEAVELIRQNRRSDVIAGVLAFIAGADFDAAVLQRVTELLRGKE